MLAVIVAGGGVECVRQGDDYSHKLMAPVEASPLLERQIAWVKSAGIDSIVLCLGLMAAELRAHFGDGSRWGVSLRYSMEPSPLGSAGAVKALGPASLPEDILIFSAELYGGAPLKPLIDFHYSHAGLATVALKPAKPSDTGPWAVLGPARRIVDFPLKPAQGERAFCCLDLCVIRRPLLHYAADQGASDLLRDVFPAAVSAGESVFGCLMGELSERAAAE